MCLIYEIVPAFKVNISKVSFIYWKTGTGFCSSVVVYPAKYFSIFSFEKRAFYA